MLCSIAMPRGRTRASSVGGDACSRTTRSGSRSWAAIGWCICAYRRYSSSLRSSRANRASLASMKSLTIVCANMLGWASAAPGSRAGKEEELGLERVAGPVVVEAGEERVLARLLEQQLGTGAAREQARERRLAGADRPFDRDVAIVLPVLLALIGPKFSEALRDATRCCQIGVVEPCSRLDA